MDKKIITIISIVVIAVIVIAALVFLPDNSETRTPEETLELFYDSINANDTAGVSDAILDVYGHYENRSFNTSCVISNITVRYLDEMTEFEIEQKEDEMKYIEETRGVEVDDICAITFDLTPYPSSLSDDETGTMALICVKIDRTWFLIPP